MSGKLPRMAAGGVQRLRDARRCKSLEAFFILRASLNIEEFCPQSLWQILLLRFAASHGIVIGPWSVAGFIHLCYMEYCSTEQSPASAHSSFKCLSAGMRLASSSIHMPTQGELLRKGPVDGQAPAYAPVNIHPAVNWLLYLVRERFQSPTPRLF